MLRAASRADPEPLQGQLELSFQYGLSFERNSARGRLETLRKALRWEAAPVLTGWDAKYNNDEPLFFERLYQPFR